MIITLILILILVSHANNHGGNLASWNKLGCVIVTFKPLGRNKDGKEMGL